MGCNGWKTTQAFVSPKIWQWRWLRETWDESFIPCCGSLDRLITRWSTYHNSVTEIPKRTWMKLIQDMLSQRHIIRLFWTEAVNMAVHVRNRTTTRSLSSRSTPCEVLFGTDSTFFYLRVFGSRWWYTLNRTNVNNLDIRARKDPMIA